MRTDKKLGPWTIFIGLALIVASFGGSALAAQGTGAYVRQVRALETNHFGLLNPAGLAYSPRAGEFIALKDNPPTPADLTVMTPFAGLVTLLPVDVNMNKATSLAFDARFNRLLILEPGRNRLTAVNADPDGRLDPSPQAVTRFLIKEYGLADPRGMAVDPATGQLCVVDKALLQMVCILPDPDGDLDGYKARDEGRITQMDLRPTGIVDPNGLALHPGDDHFYLVSPAEQRVYKLTRTGQVAAFLDLSPFELVDPQGLVVAPSGDLTDDPSTLHLYLADTGLGSAAAPSGDLMDDPETLNLYLADNELGSAAAPSSARSTAGQQPLGQIVELSLDLAPALLDAPTDQATLERTTDTSQYSPPSPDPSGLAYLPDTGTLLISDGEVNEMPPVFTGDNLFEATLSGSLVGTRTTLSFSDEPNGVAYNPLTDHLFFSDDNAVRIYETNLGADVLYGWFSTSAFGSNDPEGVAFDSWYGHLFVVDGVNAEVYDIAPGENGVFDGVPPSGDDQVTQFDTAVLGLTDPEGIEFDPDHGHLYILSDPAKTVAETTTDGTLIRYIDVTSLNMKLAAGLTYAPSSTDPAQMNLYIVARGVDNNEDPDENDGKLYEISFPPIGPPVNDPPVAEDDVYSTDEDTPLTVAAPGVLGNDSDVDGDTLTAVLVTGPSDGTLSLNADGSFDYTPNADFSGSDSFTYAANDGGADSNAATVTIAVHPVNDLPVASFTVTCSGLACDFDGSGAYDPDGSIVSYEWDYGDDSAAGSGETASHSYAAAGTYNVVLTVTDDDGETGAASQEVTVNQALTVHVGDLDGVGAEAPRARWDATVTITVHDSNENAVTGALVEGTWSGGAVGGVSCITDASGQCSVTKNNLKSNVPSVTFGVSVVNSNVGAYVAGDNHDPDGDSDGTTLIVDQPAANTPPTVNITAPISGATFASVTAIDFGGTASDAEDGDLTASLVWTSDLDGQIGTGGSFDALLSDGVHVITATAVDAGGVGGSDTVGITVGSPPAVHVSDLDGFGAVVRSKWKATVTVTVRDQDYIPRASATVSGTWGGGATGNAACTTDSSGQCSVTLGNLKLNVSSVTFTVDSVILAGYSYAPAENHDPDGDSDGTSITVSQPTG